MVEGFESRVWEGLKKLEKFLEEEVIVLGKKINSILGKGPDLHFYLEVVEQTKCASPQRIVKLLEDRGFLNILYASLVSWGMHNFRFQNKGPKLKPFEEFSANLRTPKVLKSLEELAGHSVEEFMDVETTVTKLYRCLEPLDPIRTKTKIVGRSKLLHFLLPNLIMPVDWTHTMVHFHFGVTPKNEVERFIKVHRVLSEFVRNEECRQKMEELVRIDEKIGGWNQTIPKVIDNLIIYYCKKHQDKCR
ncbi:hypothetical protein [Thermococcus paralvinellae]|uniref:Uncharacterized protein n=1 Tax=Thermococcus paralvinellae TaxID=582419 RepID=W0I615_9EURY|nr:hypothetical protein [Thermococcus paralvinellae]AHF80187.1 Hypothetical protein TES1_0801 [Thermococcus paralvinellae]